MKKSHVGLTFIRDSTVRHESFTERAPMLGGLVGFYRSPARVASPTGTNGTPTIPSSRSAWWQNISTALSSEATVQQALDGLAEAQDKVLMERLERADVQKVCGPKLNPKTSAEEWFAKAEAEGTLAPQRKLENSRRARPSSTRTCSRPWSGPAGHAGRDVTQTGAAPRALPVGRGVPGVIE